MARFSLSPPTSSSSILRQQQSSPSAVSASKTPQWKWNFPPRKFHVNDDEDDDDDDDDKGSSSSSSVSSSSSSLNDDDINDDDSDNDNSINTNHNEPPHPLGFESRYGKTRFGLVSSRRDGTSSSSDQQQQQQNNIFDRDDEYAWNALIRIDDDNHGRKGKQSSFVSPIRSYHLENRGVVSTKTLLRGMMIMHPKSKTSAYNDNGVDSHDVHETTMDELSMGMDRIANLVKAARFCRDPSEGMTSLITPRPFTQETHHQHQQQQQQVTNSSSSTPHSTAIPPPRSTSRLLQLAMECQRHQEQNVISNEFSQLQSSSEKSYQQHCQGFLLLLQAEEERVKLAKERIAQRQEQAHKIEEMGRLEREVLERKLHEQHQEQERMESERIAAEAGRLQKEHEKEQHRLELLACAEKEAEKEAAAKYQHISRAQDLIMHLDRVRSGTGLGEFDKSPLVSKRRLQFKKIVNGKINTLAHDGGKILEVSRMVCDAISNAAKEDNDMATNNNNNTNGSLSGVMTMGKKYLLDLLCSNLIVRVQADGFNGTRGDGFPLAGMFAQISVHCEEIGPVLEGHLYTVCRMAIPALSLENEEGDKRGGERKNDNDNFLMESLGMIRDKNGEFESFEKFLHRTEGLISIMANIMSSFPDNHTLLGGHTGALIWLQRFMDLLPSAPISPLPLLTAPVLVAFLTGAGHMLANKYSSEFTSLLTVMKDDLMHRLDETPIGIPSATRLKKVLEDIGLDGLRRDLPQGAVVGLYNGKENSVGGSGLPGLTDSRGLSSSLSPFGQKSSGGIRSGTDGSNHSFTSSSLGGTGSSPDAALENIDNHNMSEEGIEASPFDSGHFGSSTAAQSAYPFGGQPSLFGSTFAAAPAPSPFGGGAVQSSGFGGMPGAFASSQPGVGGPVSGLLSPPAPAPATTSSTFGNSTVAAPSPFAAFPSSGTSPFGMTATTNPSPFGATSAMSSSSFGVISSLATSPFGTSAPTPSPFGISAAAPNPSPFGTTLGTAPVSTPFSAPPFGSSPFGGNVSSAQGPSPFSMDSSRQSFGHGGGGSDSAKQPCKFFASGTCSFGDRCKFSHEVGAGQGGVGSSKISPFGVSSGRQPSNPFGGGGSKLQCKFFASGNCRNGNSCQFSHEVTGGAPGFGSSSASFGGGGFGQSNNPSPFSGRASSGGGFGRAVTANQSPFSASSASNNPFGGPRR